MSDSNEISQAEWRGELKAALGTVAPLAAKVQELEVKMAVLETKGHIIPNILSLLAVIFSIFVLIKQLMG